MVKKWAMFLRLLVPSVVPKVFGVLFFGFSAFLPIFIFILLLRFHLISQMDILIIKCMFIKKISILISKHFYT